MFGGKKKQSERDQDTIMQKSARGNMDEYEALRTIVAENAGLLTRVLDKIRIQRTLSGKSPKAESAAPQNSDPKKAK